ncbi:NAD(+) synthase [Euzebya tangerina]|uniref:NAD(+) synthase n=1 Tax=Euzebya tangerina TaxID=591198 RepID=UPI00196B2AA4|nr:NAD(+) synthase [Euzebya tangerina]
MSIPPDVFHRPTTHGLARVAAATPVATVGDVTRNASRTVELIDRADAEDVDVLVFPELNLSSYAIDDLHLQDAMRHAVAEGLRTVVAGSQGRRPLSLVGATLLHEGRLFNTAVAVHDGRILGVVPKSYLPNYREYYEKRWFTPGAGLVDQQLDLGDLGVVPFGTDLLFRHAEMDEFVVAVEICEDMWSPLPPTTRAALAGATLICNLSASNITIGKARDRALLCAAHSLRTMSAMVFSAAGPGESTTDVAWDGQGLVHELGEEVASSARFDDGPELLLADVDLGRVRSERTRTPTFADTGIAEGRPTTTFRRLTFGPPTDDPPEPVSAVEIGISGPRTGAVRRAVPRHPFVPDDPERLSEDCYEAFNIQVEGLTRRLTSINADHPPRPVIGISGGIDSTHALIVAAKATDRLGLDRSHILGVTMPGFATSEETRSNAWRLMDVMGVDGEEIDIRPAARRMLGDMGHPAADGEATYDVAFENVQAGLRTDYLFRLANQRSGIVVGTGDLSELALGWCTYGVGDQMSHYGVNSGVPKTLIQYLIRWCVDTDQFDRATDEVLEAILGTEISPELVPPDADGSIQSTQNTIGPYELHDFFLHHLIRGGAAPSKVAFLAWQAWQDDYDLEEILRWLRVFIRRFYGFSQFKRSAMPNGPKVSAAGALSPRGDWRAPSDGTAAPFLHELDANTP